MILRKPYAFFIKRFKLIHIFLTFFVAYFMYLLSKPLTFLNEYIASEHVVANADLTGILFNAATFVIPFLIIASCILVLSVMVFKKKPVTMYIFTIINYLIQIVIVNYVYNVLGKMETNLLDIRTVRFARDVLTMSVFVQIVPFVQMFVRGIGFDIKKFNFGEDLEELEITEEDREEFEVDINFDSSLLKRGMRRKIRMIKYFYVENKFFILSGLSLLIIGISTYTYLDVTVYNRSFQENEAFRTTHYVMMVDDVYETKKDKSGNIVAADGTSLILVNLKIKSNSNTTREFTTARAVLKSEGFAYAPIYKYENDIDDLGVVYSGEKIENEFINYILVYEVPEYHLNDKMILSYTDESSGISPKIVKVELTPENIDIRNSKGTTTIGSELTFEDDLLKDTKFKLTTFELEDEYKVKYPFEYRDETMDSYEYITTDLIKRNTKTIMHLKGTLDWGLDATVPEETDVIDFLNTYADLYYYLPEGKEMHKYQLEEVTIKKARYKNNYYVEVDKELKQATQIEFVISVRNNSYIYTIKE